MMAQGLFGRSHRMERSKVQRAQLNERQFWKQAYAPSSGRFKRIPALKSKEDLKHTLSSCVLWMLLDSTRPVVFLSYKLFDRWIHKELAMPVENWSCREGTDENDDSVLCSGDISPRHFRLIDKVISYLIPHLKKLTIDITWNPALHNPKLQVQNLNPVTIHSTDQGVEFACSDETTAVIDVNLRDATLQLVYDQPSTSCHCLRHHSTGITDLAEAVKILEGGLARSPKRTENLSPRKERFVLSTLRKLGESISTSENLQALQQVLSSMSAQSILRSRSGPSAVGALWIQYGLVPCLISLLLDPTKNHVHGLYQSIKNVCKSMIAYERELASKALILYICRALQQYGLRCRTVLVLLSQLMEDAVFRKIAIEQFDLGQNFARLLLVRAPVFQGEMTSLNEGDGLLMEHHQQIQVPPVYVINEQFRLPDVATVAWRVPPPPMKRNPPEQPLAQISVLKNLLLLSPLNNDGVEFRSGHLTTMLLAFVDRGLMGQLQGSSDPPPLTDPEVHSCWFFVKRIVLANVHEHLYGHPLQAAFVQLPQLHVYKPQMDLRSVDSFVKQVLDVLPRNSSQPSLMITGFRLLTDLIVSTPSAVLADITAVHLTRCFFTIRLPPLSTEMGSGVEQCVHLAAYELLEALLTKTKHFPIDLLSHFVATHLIGNVFQALDLAFEQREMDSMGEEEATQWIQKCWKLLTALIQSSRALQKTAKSQTLTEIEEQFVQEIVDPFKYHASDSSYALASLRFLSVYLDASQCLLYEQLPLLLKLLRWLRETLNRAWHQNDMDCVTAALEVLAVVCDHVSEATFALIQSFVDGLMMTLGWIAHESVSEMEQRSMPSDRTVPLQSPGLSDWRHSRPGPSRRSSAQRRDSEIQSELSYGSDGSYPQSPYRRPAQESPIRSYPVDARTSAEGEPQTAVKSKAQPKKPEGSSKALVIPPLDLAALTVVRDWQQGRRSVASTVYSSEYPVRPLSQISDLSGIQSLTDARQSTLLHSLEADRMPSWSPAALHSALNSAFYQEGLHHGDVSIQDSIPSLQLPAEAQRVKYFEQGDINQSLSSKDSVEVESSLVMASGTDDPSPSQTKILINLEKRAHSTSAMDDMTFSAVPRISVSTETSAALHKVHSFDKRRSKPSLAMRHLVGNLTPAKSEDEALPTPHLWKRGSLPNIVFAQETAKSHSDSEADRDENSGTAVTVYAGSYSTEAKELELELMFRETEEGTTSEATTTASMVALLSKYQLSKCDNILEHASVHSAVLRCFLCLLVTDYQQRSRERALTKVLALGLRQHFHYIPKIILMSLKDWATQQSLHGYLLLLKLLAKHLFDENQYPSLRRIGRGVFSSLHECSCPVIGGPSLCCVKVIDLPKDLYGMRSMKDLFMEILILQKVQHLPHVIRVYDYGITEDNLYLVMKLYSMDLFTWRQQIAGNLVRGSRLLFRVFRDIVKAVDALHSEGVLHFDLKCSNILLEPLSETPGSLYEWQDGAELPFRVVLGDFGESMLLENASEGLLRSRGTQACMSPEMLVSGSAGKRIAPGIQADAWSLGCLLYELITGELLFDDSDYSEYHTRLTTATRTLIDPNKVEKIPEEIREAVLICLSYLLVRNPAMRAPLHAVAEWLEHLLSTGALPESGRMLSCAPEAPPAVSVRNLRGFENASFLPEASNLELRRDWLPVSPTVSLMRLSAAKDPWSLSEHHITHVIFVHFLDGSQEDLIGVRNAAIRANGLLFEVLISAEEERGIHTWTDHCQRCCEKILQISTSVPGAQTVLVAGKKTGPYLRLMTRYLTHRDIHQGLNLDSSLLV